MTNANLYACLAGRFPEDAESCPFAILPDGRSTSYADLDAVSARFANTLISLGVRPGDRVAVQVEQEAGAVS